MGLVGPMGLIGPMPLVSTIAIGPWICCTNIFAQNYCLNAEGAKAYVTILPYDQISKIVLFNPHVQIIPRGQIDNYYPMVSVIYFHLLWPCSKNAFILVPLKALTIILPPVVKEMQDRGQKKRNR